MRAVRPLTPPVAPLIVAVVPWLVWPGCDDPFSTPKRAAIAVAAVLLWAIVARRPPAPGSGHRGITVIDVTALAWIATFVLSALLSDTASPAAVGLGLAGPAWALALARAAPRATLMVRAMLVTATGIAILALAQWLGADPFRAAGWAPDVAGGSQRLRVYATLGNPNFVAAWLAMHLPLSANAARAGRGSLSRAAGLLSALVLLAAVAATGSRGGALGAAAGLTTWVLWARVVRPVAAVGAAVALIGVLAWLSPARVLPETAAGRFYILMVAWPHAVDRPGLGYGPGAFQQHYPAWEQEGRKSRRLPQGLIHRFAGPQAHAHNDYLQALIERGLPGLATLLLAIAVPLWAATRRRGAGLAAGPGEANRAALVGAVAAMAACALVDFPFQRPAETFTFWTVSALLARDAATHADSR